MTIVDDFIAAEIAALSAEVAKPVEPFGYGRDLSCVTDVDEYLNEVDPFSLRALGEALARRLTTPHGTLFDDPDYGLDLRAALNRGTTPEALRALEAAIRNEAAKDDRVSEASASVSVSGTRMEVRLQVAPVESSEAFSLTFAIENGEVTLEAFAAAERSV